MGSKIFTKSEINTKGCGLAVETSSACIKVTEHHSFLFRHFFFPNQLFSADFLSGTEKYTPRPVIALIFCTSCQKMTTVLFAIKKTTTHNYDCSCRYNFASLQTINNELTISFCFAQQLLFMQRSRNISVGRSVTTAIMGSRFMPGNWHLVRK